MAPRVTVVHRTIRLAKDKYRGHVFVIGHALKQGKHAIFQA
jgi:hypothetical protein